jgi:DNA-binding response OmpR family regulator
MSQRISTKIIMVIGSDLHFCYLMRRYVRESAHPLLFAGPDDKALELAQRGKPSMIILEAGLLDARGQQMIRTLKTNHNTCHIPIIMCSWQDEDSQKVEEGADLYLRMPILYGDFLTAINYLGM